MVTGCSCDDTFSSQGVLHVWPWVVRTSAPCGSDSNFNVWSCSDEEFDDSAEEQPVSETPTAAATTTESAMRDMTSLLPIFCSAQLMKTLAQNVEMRRLLPPKHRKGLPPEKWHPSVPHGECPLWVRSGNFGTSP